MFKLTDVTLVQSINDYEKIPEGKILINTLNAYSFNNAQRNAILAEALKKGNYLVPDGISIVKACKFLKLENRPLERITGWDIFCLEMTRLNDRGGKCMFVGSSDNVLKLIRLRASTDYPNIEVITYSPPYCDIFSCEENKNIINAVNNANPDLLWIGMTDPKQEVWTYSHWNELDIKCHVGTIGAVFDFFAGTVERAPKFWQKNGLEWLYRLIKEPKRLWKRYILGNPEFFLRIMMAKIKNER